jgi:hypothetical protein
MATATQKQAGKSNIRKAQRSPSRPGFGRRGRAKPGTRGGGQFFRIEVGRRAGSSRSGITMSAKRAGLSASPVNDRMARGKRREKDWPQLNVVSIAPLIAGAVRRFLAHGSHLGNVQF